MSDWIFLGAVAILLGLFIGLPILACSNNPTTTTEIKSVSLNSELEGSFVIFAGSINQEQYYFFYKEKGDGFMLDKVSAEQTIIIETDETPRLVFSPCYENKLYVPKGTLILDYKIDQNEI